MSGAISREHIKPLFAPLSPLEDDVPSRLAPALGFLRRDLVGAQQRGQFILRNFARMTIAAAIVRCPIRVEVF